VARAGDDVVEDVVAHVAVTRDIDADACGAPDVVVGDDHLGGVLETDTVGTGVDDAVVCHLDVPGVADPDAGQRGARERVPPDGHVPHRAVDVDAVAAVAVELVVPDGEVPAAGRVDGDARVPGGAVGLEPVRRLRAGVALDRDVPDRFGATDVAEGLVRAVPDVADDRDVPVVLVDRGVVRDAGEAPLPDLSQQVPGDEHVPGGVVRPAWIPQVTGDGAVEADAEAVPGDEQPGTRELDATVTPVLDDVPDDPDAGGRTGHADAAAAVAVSQRAGPADVVPRERHVRGVVDGETVASWRPRRPAAVPVEPEARDEDVLAGVAVADTDAAEVGLVDGDEEPGESGAEDGHVGDVDVQPPSGAVGGVLGRDVEHVPGRERLEGGVEVRRRRHRDSLRGPVVSAGGTPRQRRREAGRALEQSPPRDPVGSRRVRWVGHTCLCAAAATAYLYAC
jgi:hypothetical protein